MPPWCETCQRFHVKGYWLCRDEWTPICKTETREDKMSAVEKKTTTRKEMREVEVEETTVTVTLTEKQAEVVTAILWAVDGATSDEYDLFPLILEMQAAVPSYKEIKVGRNALDVLRALPRSKWQR